MSRPRKDRDEWFLWYGSFSLIVMIGGYLWFWRNEEKLWKGERDVP